jgi:hypothetical protein
MIVGIGYRARSGKDLAAEHLIANFCFQRRAFADRLKEIAAFSFGLTQAQLYGDQKEVLDPRYDRTPRWLLQKLGEVFRSSFGAGFWIDRLFDYIMDHGGTDNRNWVIPDVRHLNECDAIKTWGGVLWLIDRPGSVGAQGGIEGHASEHELDGHENRFDLVLSNNGTVDEFKSKIDRLMGI